MVKLYRIGKEGKIEEVEPYIFPDEPTSMQSFVVANSQILGNIQVLAEQYDTRETGIIDLVGFDIDERRIKIIELKNVPVDEKIVLQVLKYALWARQNPGFFRSKIALMKDEKLKGVIKDVDEDVDYDPEVVLIAPSFSSSLLKLSQLLKVNISFLEISRYRSGDEVFITVDYKVLEEVGKRLPIEREPWDWEKYRTKLQVSDKAIEIGQALEESIDQLISNKNWDLKKNFVKGAVVYKFGWRNVALIDPYWASKKECWLQFALDVEPDKTKLDPQITKLKTKWYPQYKRWFIRIPRKDFNISPVEPLIAAAYSYVTGT